MRKIVQIVVTFSEKLNFTLQFIYRYMWIQFNRTKNGTKYITVQS